MMQLCVMTNAEKKRLAHSLYIKTDLNRKRIALQVGCTQKTLRSWIDKGGWHAIKENISITRSQLLNDCYVQLKAVNKEIMDNHDGIPSKELGYAKAVLRKEIEQLSDNPLFVYIEVFDEFTSWLEHNHPSILLEVTKVAYEFIEEKNRKNNQR